MGGIKRFISRRDIVGMSIGESRSEVNRLSLY
jgi:hypothetical protein